MIFLHKKSNYKYNKKRGEHTAHLFEPKTKIYEYFKRTLKEHKFRIKHMKMIDQELMQK